jgi:hypothetical protein
MIGEKFNRLTIIEKGSKGKDNNQKWVCKCDCGNIVQKNGVNMVLQLIELILIWDIQKVILL